ncbi:MAG TPA: tetratricopeptide repeat protein, partial [Myxococcota bacterium]|nr:tetratricopeptide repeat protein [Myxococcota bacterium]
TEAVVETLFDLAERFPDQPDPLLRASQVLAASSHTPAQWGAVVEVRRQAAERDPHNAMAWTETGRIALAHGDSKVARRLLEQAVAEEPLCARALAGLAELARRRHDITAATLYEQQIAQAAVFADEARGYAAWVLRPDGAARAQPVAGEP